MEPATQNVILGVRALALEDLGENTGLVVCVRLSLVRGIVVFSFVMTTPAVSTPSHNGQSCTCEDPSPVKSVVPTAPASLGLMDLSSSAQWEFVWNHRQEERCAFPRDS